MILLVTGLSVAGPLDIGGEWEVHGDGALPVGVAFEDAVGVQVEAVGFSVDAEVSCSPVSEQADAVRCTVRSLTARLIGRKDSDDLSLEAIAEVAAAPFAGRSVTLVRDARGSVRALRWDDAALERGLDAATRDESMINLVDRALSPFDLRWEDGDGTRGWMARGELTLGVPPVFSRLGTADVRHVALEVGGVERVETRASARWSDPEASTTGCDVEVRAFADVVSGRLLARDVTLSGTLQRPMEPDVPFTQSVWVRRLARSPEPGLAP